jgi:hypothetical protein
MPRKPKEELDTRGQITVPLDADYVLRPSYEAISSIERQLGLSLHVLADLATTSRLNLEQMGVIVAEMMHAFGKASPEDAMVSTYRGCTPEKVSELIFEASPAKVMARIVPLLIGALTGGYDASGELKATK